MPSPSDHLPGLRVRLLRAEDQATWNAFVARAPGGHALQSWEWGAFNSEWGWQARRLVVERADAPPGAAILAGAQVLLRRAVPRLPLRVAYVPRGPLADPLGGAPRVS